MLRRHNILVCNLFIFLVDNFYCEQFEYFHRTFHVTQLNQTPQVPAGLRALKNTNPRVSHFGIDANTSITVGRRIFCSATWNELNVTLCIAFDLATHVSRKEFYLAPIIEFIDSPPKEIIDNGCLPTNKQLEGISSYHVAFNSSMLLRNKYKYCFICAKIITLIDFLQEIRIILFSLRIFLSIISKKRRKSKSNRNCK